jgi:hypothetical protein
LFLSKGIPERNLSRLLSERTRISPLEIKTEGEAMNSTPNFNTTRWENVKNRVEYLKRELLVGDGAEWALALCEELDRMDERIDAFHHPAPKAEPTPSRPGQKWCPHIVPFCGDWRGIDDAINGAMCNHWIFCPVCGTRRPDTFLHSKAGCGNQSKRKVTP